MRIFGNILDNKFDMDFFCIIQGFGSGSACFCPFRICKKMRIRNPGIIMFTLTQQKYGRLDGR